jgi:hypothetical protein
LFVPKEPPRIELKYNTIQYIILSRKKSILNAIFYLIISDNYEVIEGPGSASIDFAFGKICILRAEFGNPTMYKLSSIKSAFSQKPYLPNFPKRLRLTHLRFSGIR